LDGDPVCNFAVVQDLVPLILQGKGGKIHTEQYNDTSSTGLSIASDAAALLAWDIKHRAGQNIVPHLSGALNAYRVDTSNNVRVSAAAAYSDGAPTIEFAWDFTTDGKVDMVTSKPWVTNLYGINLGPISPKKRTAITSVTVTHADKSQSIRTICIRLANNGSVTC
jgi:hypothetical protein